MLRGCVDVATSVNVDVDGAEVQWVDAQTSRSTGPGDGEIIHRTTCRQSTQKITSKMRGSYK